MKKLFSLLLFSLTIIGCNDDSLPKPKGYLRLEYPNAEYKSADLADCPFEFDYNKFATIRQHKNCDYNIVYPSMRATINLTYKQVTTNNIDELLKDAQQFTYHHTKKATSILEQPYVNPKDKVYGMFYEVGGDAASSTQFYLTDSIRNFITGSVYFRVRPNADSILPAAEYLKEDVRVLIESLRWK